MTANLSRLSAVSAMFWNKIRYFVNSLKFRAALLSGLLFVLFSLLCSAAIYYLYSSYSLAAADSELSSAADDILCIYLTGQKGHRLGEITDEEKLPVPVINSLHTLHKDFRIIFAFFARGRTEDFYTVTGVSRMNFYLVSIRPSGRIVASRMLNPARNIPELRRNFPGWHYFNDKGLFFRLSNEKGATLAGADSPRALQAFRNPGKEYRAEKRILYNQKVLECAVSLAPFYKRQQRLFQSILFIFLALLPLGMFAGYLVASYMTKGLKKIRNAALKISAGDLAHRVNWEENSLAGGEIGSLVSAFNTMSANNERLVTELRTVTDDIAHDLRTPLTRIRGTAELSVMKCSSRSCREAYGSIAEECDAMISIIGDMLEISRSETGIRKPEKTCFSLTQLLEKLFEVYKMTAEELGQKWKLQVPEKEIQIHADEIKLQRVFTNLLDNAAKFMGEGGSLFFTLLPPENHFVTMRVADTGPGIPDDCKEKVFKRFFRMDSSRSTSGNGLGLALAAAIIHAHDGTIHVEDTPGGGATFVIKLPLR